MAKNKTDITELSQGLHLDNDPIAQPKATYRFALNAVEETGDGEHGFKSNERSCFAASSFPEGFYPIGHRYIEDDSIFIILTNPSTNKDEIGIIDKADIYTTIINTGILGLDITHQCDITYRLRRGNERCFYWVDGLNNARAFNLDRLQNFYTTAYQDFIKAGGDPFAFIGDKWNEESFSLIKTYNKIPVFNSVEIVESGNTLPGSYNFAIQLVDDDLNTTEWITTSNTVNIFNDSTNNTYGRIRGSRNVTSDSQSFPRASKSIKLSIGNFDTNFPYYRVAIIRAAGNTGEPEKVLISDMFSTSDSNFLYTGNDAELTDGALEDILIENQIIYAPQHIEQLENRLCLANGKGKSIDWCDFQKTASKIKADLVTKQVILNNIDSDPNVKNANSTFKYGGYMPGEAYSFGIVYIMKDGSLSPVCHIPGKSTASSSLMKVYELDNRYLDIHSCAKDNYWGVDSQGDTLVGKKVRHHRFPFRQEVGKPLYQSLASSSTINRYVLKLVFTLNPAWTGGTVEYPLDGGGNPIVISYVFNYQLTGAAGVNSYSGVLTNLDVINNTFTIIYDGLETLDITTGIIHYTLDPTSELATAYQLAGNERFIITETYSPVVLSTSTQTDVSEIFGLNFSNIQKPHPDVVGFYIVRNERGDDDKLIIDNAIFGAMTSFAQYRSFGLLMPKQFYTASNCGRTDTPHVTLTYDNKGVWFFNPEFEYFGKKQEFDEVKIEGRYEEQSVQMPTISNQDGSPCNGILSGGGSKGVYIENVQAGTSYNPDINKKKDKDDDGFDLIIGYRNTNVTFNSNYSTPLPLKQRVIYLNAASYRDYDGEVFYNVSSDNKIGMYVTEVALDTNELFNSTTHKNNLLYGSLVKHNKSAYSNYLNRPYYKEHNNPVLFADNDTVNNVNIYNGDADISSTNIVSSVFNDIVVAKRAKKSRLLQIIVGAILVVAGVALTIVTAGAGATVLGLAISAVTATALSSLAISYGVSLFMSGLKFEAFKNMIETDYEKGLRETVTDGGVYECIRAEVGTFDDTIRWFSDRVSNLYIESSVPFGLRSGLTSGVTDFTDSPMPYEETEFRTYLTEKLTALDRDQGSGRLYKGYAGAEIYDMNKDFMRFNKQKIFYHLPIDYDCCNDTNEIYPDRVWWSQQSFQEEKTDNFRIFLPNNYKDIEGEHGEITDMYRLGRNLFIHTKEALWQLPQNNQERVTGEIISFIGTGSFFSIPPVKVLDDDLGSAGTSHKWATIKTKGGVVFVSENESKIYLHTDKIKDISQVGLRNWFEEKLESNIKQQLYERFTITYINSNNPANPNGTGYVSSYDTRFNRVLITKRDYSITDYAISSLVLVDTTPTIANGIFSYSKQDGRFYLGDVEVPFSNTTFFENKSWTISYSFHSGKWISWHSYIPNYYITSQNGLFSFIHGSNSLWKHNQEGNYQTFYGNYSPFILEIVLKSDGIVDKIIDDATIQTTARFWDSAKKQYVDDKYTTFTHLVAFNSFQATGELNLIVKDNLVQPENWYKQQIENTINTIAIKKHERNWYINELRSAVIDNSKPLFTSQWDDIKGDYYIDKVVNPVVISFDKEWWQAESLRDKYMIVRLKYSNFNNVNIIMNFVLNNGEMLS